MADFWIKSAKKLNTYSDPEISPLTLRRGNSILCQRAQLVREYQQFRRQVVISQMQY